MAVYQWVFNHRRQESNLSYMNSGSSCKHVFFPDELKLRHRQWISDGSITDPRRTRMASEYRPAALHKDEVQYTMGWYRPTFWVLRSKTPSAF
jgi:hypothetical protein